MTTYILIGSIIAVFLGLIPATIAKNKGYSFGLWWAYGWALFIVAIIHVQFIPDKTIVNHNQLNHIPVKERNNPLVTQTEMLYAQGAPVIIVEKTLLKGSQTGTVQATIGLRNISGKDIKAATVLIYPLDTAERPLGEAIKHQYLDFIAERDDEFGRNESITLPDPTTRAFSVVVSEIIFTDNSIWSDTSEIWETLVSPQLLDDTIEDPELLKQYQIKYGKDCHYTAANIKDLWYCTCGALNRQEEVSCFKCGRMYSDIKTPDWENLAFERDVRVNKEKLEKEEAEQRKNNRIIKIKQTTKKCALIVVPTIVCCSILFLLITQIIIPNSKYKNAESLLEDGKYQEALTAFKSLGDYKDSSEQVREVKYQEAVSLQEKGQYTGALKGFQSLGNYKDSSDRATMIRTEIRYKEAVSLQESGKNAEAITAFEALGNYKDCSQRIIECNEAIHKYYSDCQSIAYDTLKSTPDEYKGQKITISGHVVQVCSEASSAEYYSSRTVKKSRA